MYLVLKVMAVSESDKMPSFKIDSDSDQISCSPDFSSDIFHFNISDKGQFVTLQGRG
jgi:hypothetical protein